MTRWHALPLLALALLARIQDAAARSATGDRVLVVLEHALAKSQYGRFFASLEERGFELTFKGPREEQSPLEEYGEKRFDHLIMMAPSAKSFSDGLSPRALVAQLTEHSINTLFVLSSDLSEIQRDLAREFDVEFEERETGLLDYFSHGAGGTHEVLLRPEEAVSRRAPSSVVTPASRRSGPIVYSGVAHALGQTPLLVPVLHGQETSFSGELTQGEEDVPEAKGRPRAVLSGRGASLVSALQTRGNARVGWIGSESMLRDGVWGVEGTDADGKTYSTGNAAFVDDFTRWVFQETGVLRVIETAHHRVDEVAPREMYRIKDDLTYSITLAQHETTPNGTSSWAPFHADDLQLEFTMLDPHVRTRIPEAGPGRAAGTEYSVTFKAPDRHGVFKFVVDYWRPGWTFISESTTASVVPFRHDEYPRWIRGAWPFYSGALSVSAAFLLFCAVWLYTAERPGVRAAAAAKGKKVE